MYDAFGKVVITKTILPGIAKLNVSSLANGVYNIVIIDKDGLVTGNVKFIKD